MSHIAHVACPHDCPDSCLMDVTVDHGRAVSVRANADHPFTRGALCAKVNKFLDRVYAPDRLLHPVRRVGPKGPGARFEQISWDEAIATTCRQMRAAIDQHGPQSILPYSYRGNNGVYQSNGLDRRFFHALGASTLARTICAGGLYGALAYSDVFFGFAPEGLVNSKLIIFWAANPLNTGFHVWPLVQEARRRGARVITIDPYRSRTARAGDEHVFIRPGTDAALALAMLKVIEHEGLVDADYVREYSLGYEAFVDRLHSLSLAELSAACGIPLEKIQELARDYATTRPAAIRIGIGIQRNGGAAAAIRAVACLPALTGAWREVGGGLCNFGGAMFTAQNMTAVMRPDLSPPGTREINMVRLAEHLLDPTLDPPIKVIYNYNCNPAASLPDQTSLRRALQRPDLFTVVHDMFLTDSADYADIVLPATSPLEHDDAVLAYGGDFGSFSPQAIAPLGEAKSNAEVFQLLAAGLGITEPAVYASASQLTAESLKKQVPSDAFLSQPFVRTRSEPDLLPRARGGFLTPSGKFEFWCEKLARDGLDPLPGFVPPHETLSDGPYPLNFLPRKHKDSLNSSYGHLPVMRRQENTARTLEIHPDDAAARGLQDGADVRVFNARGAFVMPLTISTNVAPGTVATFWGWWDKLSGGRGNVNNVTSAKLTDLGGGGTFYDCRVEVEPWRGAAGQTDRGADGSGNRTATA
ncbi:MAG: molybdopterin-dependent oxidoreductase [Desulfurellaceae bacterium]|nr:molybdopterin-dependent oxidoreductase [Desulfurellaceae bacterium]